MRGYTIVVLVLAMMAGTLASCSHTKVKKTATSKPVQPAGSTAATTPSPSTGPSTATSENESTPHVMSGTDIVLDLRLPDGVKGYNKDGKYTVVDAKGAMRFYLWIVDKAKNVNEAVALAPEIISSEFIEFKPAEMKDVTVAGSPAKQLTGPGKEADDHDPGNAEVIIFSAAGKVFVACVHGEEKPTPALHNFMMKTIETAKAPIPFKSSGG